MTERRSRTRRQKLLGILPAMLVYLAVATVGPWLHLRAHHGSPVAAVQADHASQDGAPGVEDPCELCRMLGGHALAVEAAESAALVAGDEPGAEPSADAPRRPPAAGQPRAPPAPIHSA